MNLDHYNIILFGRPPRVLAKNTQDYINKYLKEYSVFQGWHQEAKNALPDKPLLLIVTDNISANGVQELIKRFGAEVQTYEEFWQHIPFVRQEFIEELHTFIDRYIQPYGKKLEEHYGAYSVSFKGDKSPLGKAPHGEDPWELEIFLDKDVLMLTCIGNIGIPKGPDWAPWECLKEKDLFKIKSYSDFKLSMDLMIDRIRKSVTYNDRYQTWAENH